MPSTRVPDEISRAEELLRRERRQRRRLTKYGVFLCLDGLLTLVILFSRTSEFRLESQCGSCLFLRSLLLFEGQSTPVHLPVLCPHVYSMGKLIIFFCTLPTHCPSLGLTCSATAELYTLQSHCYCSDSYPLPLGVIVPKGPYTIWARVYGKILLCYFFTREFRVQVLPEGSTPQWEGGAATRLLRRQVESIRGRLHEIFKMSKPIQVCFFLQSAPAPPLPLIAALPFLLPPAATAVWGDRGASCEGSSACSKVI